jgi:hypothetical protein
MGFEKTIFLTYMLASSQVVSGDTSQPYTVNKSYGYSSAIHCNYIQRLETDSLINKTINFIVPDGSLFPFMKDYYLIQPGQNGYGWNANYLYALVQIVDGTGSTITADPANWSIIDVTPQLDNYDSFSGTTIPVAAFNSSTIITIGVQETYNAPKYDLTYLNAPSTLPSDDNKLTFGEEAFFYGNVKTDFQAIAYTTEIPAVLQLNEFNSTTNPTWDQFSAVSISEMGIFDDNNNLVGIGKLNNPINKDATIFRTILFALDF